MICAFAPLHHLMSLLGIGCFCELITHLGKHSSIGLHGIMTSGLTDGTFVAGNTSGDWSNILSTNKLGLP